MVQLYCNEQIAVPQNLPHILKIYAKDAIKTQPYDILAWSASYFRCLANKQPPPAKARLEKPCRYKGLTRGYVKALIELLGKGYFVSRCLLQKRWKELCLPEDELFKFLSLCQMLNWPQLHWLKVLATMIASLNCSLEETVVMLCELLTDEIDGAPAQIPFWMFKICYTFLAEMDCSEEQCFMDGRKVRTCDGELENATEITTLPRILSASLLKDTIIAQCKLHSIDPHKCPTLGENCSVSVSSCDSLNIKLTNSGQVLDKCEDFDALVLLINNKVTCDVKKDETANLPWPHCIFQKHLELAKRDDEICIAKRDKQASIAAKAYEGIKQKEALKLINDVGPPWTWFYQFTQNNCDNASYNFIEIENLALESAKSCAENKSDSIKSFNFAKEEPLIAPKATDNNQFIFGSSSTPVNSSSSAYSLENLQMGIVDADQQQDDDLKRNLMNFMQKDEKTDIDTIMRAMEAASSGFPGVAKLDPRVTSMADLISYLKNVVPAPQTKLIDQNVPPPSMATMDVGSIQSQEETVAEEGEEEGAEVEAVADLTTTNMAAVFQKSGVSEDKTLLSYSLPSELVLGLADHLPQPKEEIHVSEFSEISCSGTLTGDGNRSDDSSIFDLTPTRDMELDMMECCKDHHIPRNLEKPMTFECTIPAMPGIGPKVSQATMDKFLLYLRFRARNQHGLIKPQNFKEQACPYMTDENRVCLCPETTSSHNDCLKF